MRSYEVLRDAADRIGVKVLASKLRVSPALVYKWCQPPETDENDSSGARNPLDRLSEIVELTHHLPVVSWLCQEAGGFFVHNPRTAEQQMESDLLLATQQVVAGFSGMLSEVSRSIEDDNMISPEEADRIRETWERLKTVAETFVVACERGVYHREPRAKK